MRNASRGDILAAFWKQMRPYKGRLFFVVLFMTAAYFAEALMPWAGKQLVDHLASAGDRSWAVIRSSFLAVVAITVFSWLFRRVADRVASTFRSEVSDRRARNFGFGAIMERPYAYFLDTPAGTAIRSVEKFSQAIGETFEQVIYNLLNPVFLVGVVLVSLSVRSWLLGAGFAVWTAGFVALQWYLSKKQEKMRAVVREADAVASGRLADVIGNAAAVKTFAAEAREAAGVDRVLASFVKKERDAWTKEENYWAVQSFFFVILEVALVAYVLDGWTRGTFTVGDFVLVQGSAALLFSPMVSLGSVFRRLPRMFSYASDVVELSQTPPEIRDAPEAKKLRVSGSEIEFNRVVFGYNEGPAILKDFSLTIKPGEKVAFIGPSGAGKSTIVKMLYRFYDPRKGTILIDGQDIADVTQESLRSVLSLVPQDPALFHRTIIDNIRYARPGATEREVIAAARRAHCHEFVSRLPDGYKTMVGERGVKLSGGERQRVAIARAILADAPILVLDEATSSLDSESEALIQDALRGLMRDKTVLVIAHRLSTIMEMDRIVVMENGRVADQGTHQELSRRAGTYRRLWELQSGGYIAEGEGEE